MAAASSNTQGDVSLLQFLDLSQLTCLNESAEHPLHTILSSKTRNTSDAYLESDADEQLLLNIPFHQVVRVRSVVVHSKHPELGPQAVKFFVNQPSIGFDDVQDATEPSCAQIVDLSKEDVRAGNLLSLRYVRFQAVNSLHIFVASNQGGGEVTRIDALDVFGVPVLTTKDVTGLKKVEEGF